MDEILDNLSLTISEFLVEIKDNFVDTEEERIDLMGVEFWFKRLDPEDLADIIIRKVLPHKKAIEERQLEFFYKARNDIFRGIEQSKIDSLASKFDSGNLSENDVDVIFQYFDSIVTLAEEYKKNK